jgi:hypothetical protein
MNANALFFVLAALTVTSADAQRIFSCNDSKGRRTSDRPFTDCQEQSELRRDGAVKQRIRPELNEDERQAVEAQRRKDESALREAQARKRQEQNLLIRFPNEAAHERARQIEVGEVRKAIRLHGNRIDALKVERKRLADEEEFHPNRLPAWLRARIDANEASQSAQRDLLQSQEVALERVTAKYDTELVRLGQLWK